MTESFNDNKRLFLISQILLFWGVILYLYSIYKTGIISYIPPGDVFGLLNELDFLFFPSVLIVTISIIMQILNSRTKDYHFIMSLLVLAFILWATPTIVEKNPKMWDAWGVGFQSNEIITYHGINFITIAKDYYLRYLQFPGSFILFAIFLLISRLDLIYFVKIYPFFSIPITVLFVYCMYKILVNTLYTKYTKMARFNTLYIEQTARFSTLIFILLNSYIHLHLSPESIGWPLFFILIALLLNVKKSINFKLLFCIVSLAIVITHPTTGLLVILFLSWMFILNKFIEKYKLIWIMFISMFIFWSFFMAQQMIVDNVISRTINIMTNESSVTPVPIVSSLPQPQNIRLYTFAIGMVVTFVYICIKRPNLIFPAIFLSSISFYFFSSLSNIGFLERTYQMGFIVISLTIACIISNINHTSVKFLPIIFLITTSTLYIYEYRDINPDNLISGYNFILNNYNNSFSILQSPSQSQIFLIIDTNKVHRLDSMSPRMENILKDIRNKKEISFPRVIALSDKAEGDAIKMGYGEEYNQIKILIDNSTFDKIYDTTILRTYIKKK